jgi:signal peptide peptidase SppA
MENILFEADLRCTTWAMEKVAVDGLLARVQGGLARSARSAMPAPPSRPMPGSIAVIPLVGVLMQRASALAQLFGISSTTTFADDIARAAADDSVRQILIEIDSPGGGVFGVFDAAQSVAKAKQLKPVVAVANSIAASAAYWIGSQASEFFVTPGGEVGGIGVYKEHEDLSGAYQKAGVKVTLISAGKYKTESHPFGPLSPEAKAFEQSRLNDYLGMFSRDVARGRGTTVERVRADMGQGRVLGPDAAVGANMVDGVLTFDQVVAQMTIQAIRGRASQAGSAANDRDKFLRKMQSEIDQTERRNK